MSKEIEYGHYYVWGLFRLFIVCQDQQSFKWANHKTVKVLQGTENKQNGGLSSLPV